MESLLRDIRYGFRTLAKNPGFTMVAVLTLALGIGANTAIFSVVENLLLRPLPYPQPARLVEIANTYPSQVPKAGWSPGDNADWKRENQSFSEMGSYAEISKRFNLTGDGEPERAQVGYASSDLFPMLGARAVAGRSFVPEENRAGNAPVVILSSRLWQSRFGGDPGVVGRTITLDNKRYTVVGILPAGFQLLRWADLWMPLGQYDDDLTEHVHHALSPSPGLNRASAFRKRGTKSDGSAVVHKVDSNLPIIHVRPMDNLISDSVSLRRFSSALVAIFGALALLLATIGIYGVMSYTVSRRTQEIGVRMALGAQLASVRGMILGQTLKLALVGVGLGLAGAFVVARFLASLLFGVGMYDPVTFLGVATLLVAIALAASYIPARRPMRVDPIIALRYE
jgi:putative ABC transport system permease protein